MSNKKRDAGVYDGGESVPFNGRVIDPTAQNSINIETIEHDILHIEDKLELIFQKLDIMNIQINELYTELYDNAKNIKTKADRGETDYEIEELYEGLKALKEVMQKGLWNKEK